MLRYLTRRFGTFLPTLLAASFLIFVFIRLIPGDPAAVMLGDQATAEEVAALRDAMGLDEPLLGQYLRWLWVVVQGDLGDSIFFQVPVLDLLVDGFETSFLLALMTMVWIVLFGLPIGMLAAVRRGTWLDQGLSGVAMFLASVPTFWVGLYLILIFAAILGWLRAPAIPRSSARGASRTCVTCCFRPLPSPLRMRRSSSDSPAPACWTCIGKTTCVPPAPRVFILCGSCCGTYSEIPCSRWFPPWGSRLPR